MSTEDKDYQYNFFVSVLAVVREYHGLTDEQVMVELERVMDVLKSDREKRERIDFPA